MNPNQTTTKKMKPTYTIRIDRDTYMRSMDYAKERGWSFNTLVNMLLKEAISENETVQANKISKDRSSIS